MSDLIEREDVLNVLKRLGWTPIDSLYLIMEQDIPSVVLDMSEFSDRLWKNAYERGKADGTAWIPCSERLPEEKKGVYLICTEDGYICSCRWTNVNPFWADLTVEWHWCEFDIPQYNEVVAWMDLKPWKGADDGSDNI